MGARSAASVLVLLVVAGCGSSSNSGDGGSADLSAAAGPDMLLPTRCGHPGDVGNSLGVGQFCTNQGPDCSTNSKAKSCSALFNGQTPSPTDSYFCSFQCQPTDPPGTCGENAVCLCDVTVICGCVPTSCIPPGDGGA